MLEIGQYVVKANTGVCRVVEITAIRVSEEDEEERQYYHLVPYGDEKGKILVPVGAEKSSLRLIMTTAEASSFIEHIPSIAAAWIESDRLREAMYKEAIKSNDPERLVSMIKNLYIRNRQREQQGKKSTAVDERYIKIAESALYQELAVALGKLPEEVKELVVGTFTDLLM